MAVAVCATILPSTSLIAGTGGADYSGGPSSAADAEVIKRLQRIENALAAEAQGDRLMADGDYEGALNKYQEALSMIPNAPMTAAHRQRIIAKFSQACIKQADKLGKMGRFDEAKNLLKRVLADDVDPNNSSAKTLLARLDDPDYYNPAMTEGHYKNTEEVSRLLKLGMGYYDLGQWDQAQEAFNKVLSIDRHNTAARRNLERTEREIDNYLLSARDHTRQKMIRMVDEVWETAVPRTVTIPTTTGNDSTDQKGSAILLKLKNIVLQRLNFEGATIEEVISYLRTKSVELDNIDPNKSGVNFILQTKGKPGNPITLDLRDVPMLVALDQISQLAGLAYRVESHAVVLTSLEGASGKLESRVFRVPPTFLSSAGGATGAASTAAPVDPFAAPTADTAAPALAGRPNAKQVLTGLGASFEAAGSEATFLAGSSRLVVKNTLAQLDFIEKIIEDMKGGVTKQVNITTKFVEISQRNTDELGFDTLIGAFNIGNRAFGSGGTPGNGGAVNPTDYPFLDPTSTTSPTITGQNVVSNGLRSGGRAIATNAIDGLLANGIASQGANAVAPGILALAGVFTDPQFQIVLRALSQKKGVDLMTAPSIVTRSGQRAKIEIIREFPYPTDFDPPQIPQTFGTGGAINGGGGTGAGTTTVSGSFPVTPTTPTTFEVRNTGVSMEVDPVIGEDGYTIDLNLAPEVVEFEGFINYGSPIGTSAVNALGVPTTVVLTENRIEQPVFATRKLNTAVTIWDGQTVGIGGLMREDVQMVEDKVPLLGDIPFLGRLFKTKSEEHFKKNLMIYVSAKLIDPSGAPFKQNVESSSGGNGNPLFPSDPAAP
jgi:general secretion pathway protein D